MIIKPINPPSLAISAQGTLIGGSNTQINSLMPIFSGTCTLETDSREIEDSFKFSLFKGELLITSTDWIAHKVQQDDIWYCNTVLEHREIYSILYEIKTNNGYYASSDKKSFTPLSSTIGTLDVNFYAVENRDNARVDLYITKGEETNFLTGNYVISRTSEETNFQRFNDIKFVTYNMQSISDLEHPFLAFSDYTIESGVTYQYAIQQVLTENNRTNVRPTERICINFENAYLFRDNIQLRLSFNQNISSFKHTVLRNKQDTLGDKYPHLSQNGNAYYSEFQISGLISYQDNVDSFFKKSSASSGMYYQDELILSADKFEVSSSETRSKTTEPTIVESTDHKDRYAFEAADAAAYAYADDMVATPDRRSLNEQTTSSSSTSATQGPVDYSITPDLTDNNIYIERKFREKAEEFLNDFNVKLYRSATEGNIVVALMNITLKPVETLGRMLYEFSATAYELTDSSLEELDKYGIISIGEEQSSREIIESLYSFGQIRVNPLKSANENKSIINITDLIKDDAYFKVTGTTEEYALSDIKRVWIESDGIPVSAFLRFSINGTDILIPSNKIYTLNIPAKTDASGGSSDDSYDGAEITLNSIDVTSTYSYSVIINYICIVSLRQQQEVGQVGPPEDILDFGQTVWNGETNNIISFIKDDIARKNEFSTDENGEWRKDNYTYTFDHIKAIDFETQIGATIEIGKSSTDYETFEVGYRHNPGGLPVTPNSFISNRIFFPVLQDGSDIHSRYITLTNARQAIINYTFEMRKQSVAQSSGL